MNTTKGVNVDKSKEVLPADDAAIVRRFYEEIFNQGNAGAMESLVAADFIDHIPQLVPGQPSTGRDALAWFVDAFRSAFPDLRVTVEELVQGKTDMIARVTWSGTHSGDFLGIAPSGKSMQVMGLDLIRISGGRIAEHWGLLDVLSMLDQLGYLPQGEGSPM